MYSKRNSINNRGLLTIVHYRNEHVSYSLIAYLSFAMKITITVYFFISQLDCTQIRFTYVVSSIKNGLINGRQYNIHDDIKCTAANYI